MNIMNIMKDVDHMVSTLGDKSDVLNYDKWALVAHGHCSVPRSEIFRPLHDYNGPPSEFKSHAGNTSFTLELYSTFSAAYEAAKKVREFLDANPERTECRNGRYFNHYRDIVDEALSV